VKSAKLVAAAFNGKKGAERRLSRTGTSTAEHGLSSEVQHRPVEEQIRKDETREQHSHDAVSDLDPAFGYRAKKCTTIFEYNPGAGTVAFSEGLLRGIMDEFPVEAASRLEEGPVAFFKSLQKTLRRTAECNPCPAKIHDPPFHPTRDSLTLFREGQSTSSRQVFFIIPPEKGATGCVATAHPWTVTVGSRQWRLAVGRGGGP